MRALRVLIVDDDLDAAYGLAWILRDMGHSVDFAITGFAALDIAPKLHPDVVILEMVLPDFDGADLSRLLRGKVASKTLRIIAITARGGEEAARRAREAGCDDFLLKPLQPERIEKLLS